MSDYSSLDDDRIVTIVDSCLRRSVGYYDSQLSKERAKVMDYYGGRLPKPAHDGNSRFVSQDVYDAVESAKAALLETFSTGNRIIRFAPRSADDVALAEVATAYADHVCFQQNNLYSVMSEVIHDGLIARAGVAKVFWEKSRGSSIEYIEDMTEDIFPDEIQSMNMTSMSLL